MSGHSRTRCVVPVSGTRALALSSIRGEALVSHAVGAAASAGLDVFVVATDDVVHSVKACLASNNTVVPVVRFADLVVDIAELNALVIHDPLCPLTPAAFLASMPARADDVGAAVGVLGVTDTIKSADGPTVTGTVDRTTLAMIASPLALTGQPLEVIRREPELCLDMPALVARLSVDAPVEFVPAPPTAARVGEPSELQLLESVDEVRHLISDR